jgi:hypothetical protein
VTVALNDPAKTAPVSQRKIDIIVLQRFSGAFRAGIAGIYGAPDQKFEPRTAPGSSQAEIVRTTRTPVEFVLGYSIYFEGLGDRPGRSYFTHDGNTVQDGHGGFYLGFGAVSVSGTNSVDFLKSLYAGLEYEFSPYFAVALTGVVRRSRTAVSAAGTMGHSSSNPSTLIQAVMSSIARTSAPSRASHGVPASRCFASVRSHAWSPRRVSASTRRSASVDTS